VPPAASTRLDSRSFCLRSCLRDASGGRTTTNTSGRSGRSDRSKRVGGARRLTRRAQRSLRLHLLELGIELPHCGLTINALIEDASNNRELKASLSAGYHILLGRPASSALDDARDSRSARDRDYLHHRVVTRPICHRVSIAESAGSRAPRPATYGVGPLGFGRFRSGRMATFHSCLGSGTKVSPPPQA
jgi:hypothetical protein